MSKEDFIMLLGSISECVRAGALNPTDAERYVKLTIDRILDLPFSPTSEVVVESEKDE
jgi:hypothetical protein